MKPDRLRQEIDRIDRELFTLLEERLDLALRARRARVAESPPGGPSPATGRGLIEPEFAASIRQVIAAEGTRLHGARPRLVGFQGDHGAYGELAARTLVPAGAYLPCLEFADVFQGVADGDFDLGAVPVENSLEGAVTAVNDLLTRTDLTVVGEVEVPIHHCLLAREGTRLADVRVVYSHPQALGQCRAFLADHGLEPRPYYDTAGAARMLTREQPRAAAAIASSLAGELYGLEVLAADIEDQPQNTTRFLLLSRQPLDRPGDKCSIIFAVRHQSGSLFAALERFARADINLTRIASMPLRTDPGNYSFFLDFEGSPDQPAVAEVLAELETTAAAYKFLGCYPAA